MEDELSPLSCQLAFVLGRLGRLAEASELYDKMIRGWVVVQVQETVGEGLTLRWVCAKQGRSTESHAVPSHARGTADTATSLFPIPNCSNNNLSDESTRAIAHNNAIADAPHRLEPGPQNRKYINSCTKRLEALLDRPGAKVAAAGDESGAAVGALAGYLARNTTAGSLPRFAEGLESRLGARQKMQLLLNLGLLYLVGPGGRN